MGAFGINLLLILLLLCNFLRELTFWGLAGPFKIKVTQLYWTHEGRKTPRSAVVDVLFLFTAFVGAPPSVHWQLLTTVDWHPGRGSRRNCKLLTDPSCTKKEARVKFFHISFFKTPSDVSGCPKLGFVAVCRMSRHEGELINRTLVRGYITWAANALVSFAICTVVVMGLLRFSRFVFRLVYPATHIFAVNIIGVKCAFCFIIYENGYNFS